MYFYAHCLNYSSTVALLAGDRYYIWTVSNKPVFLCNALGELMGISDLDRTDTNPVLAILTDKVIKFTI